MNDSRDEPSLPAAHALHLAEVVARFKVTSTELFAGLALDEATLSDPARRLPISTVESLVTRARALTGEPGLGFHLGLQMRVSAHGYLGFAAMASSTVREALDLAARFAPTRTTAIGLRVHKDGDLASLVIEERAPLGAARDVVLLALVVGIQKIGEALTGKALSGRADLAFPEPAYLRRFEHLVAGRIRFDQPVNQLVFSTSVLDLPIAMADPAALRLAREQCERELQALGFGARLCARVNALLPRDDGGFRSLEEVAALLHVSPRTLKRHLAAEGTAYSELLDAHRRDRALLLLSSELSLEHVAERVGYSDMSNFTRAFRRWTGATPGAFRSRSGAR